MLNPSIDELMNKINSKYTLVTVSARRAREIQNEGSKPMISKTISQKSVGVALEEIDQGMLFYHRDKDDE
ncbi:DNA-directed RNA polymerase subunit omega [Bacillus tianshenii]|nr:DNA-directed RNA polymerase subunit omega [Bacillus tianshenii]